MRFGSQYFGIWLSIAFSSHNRAVLPLTSSEFKAQVCKSQTTKIAVQIRSAQADKLVFRAKTNAPIKAKSLDLQAQKTRSAGK